MRKSEFIAAVSAKAETTQRDAERIIEALSPVIIETCIEKGDEVNLPIGKFKRKVNPAKTGVNPLTKKQMNVPESHTLSFKPSKTVKVVIDPKKTKKK